MATNGVMLQGFQWYSNNDGGHWGRLASRAPALADLGITAVWIPPCYKGWAGANDVGYAVYDLFDLGEFDQKTSTRTKYGTRAQLLDCIQQCKHAGLHVYADIVINHRMGADAIEKTRALHVAYGDRNRALGDWHDAYLWTRFTFPGRGDTYSSMKWNHDHFDAVIQDNNIFKIKGKTFETHVDPEYGNYDALMGCDLDYDNPWVKGEIEYWGTWFYDQMRLHGGVDGFRFDAVKHVRSFVFLDWLNRLNDHAEHVNPGGHPGGLFGVGEYWSPDLGRLRGFLADTQYKISLFDVPLHYNFHRASTQHGYDLRTLFDNTLTKHHPMQSVSFVDNHDSQPLQSLESWVEAWFKPLAYALILLRQQAYPCVFDMDLTGAYYRDRGRDGNEHDIHIDSHRFMLETLLHARRHHAYGDQHDYFDHPACIGWTRTGDNAHPKALAVVMCNGDRDGSKHMRVNRPGKTFKDVTGHCPIDITAGPEDYATFYCPPGKVSVWVER